MTLKIRKTESIHEKQLFDVNIQEREKKKKTKQKISSEIEERKKEKNLFFTVHQNCEQTIKKWLQSLMTRSYNFMKNGD